ncbi:hypothetical protein EJ994_02375 [Maribacter sp. MJ134]|uniref:hypothetical protein n=1 Tax=Maribacter sp. MJ134 TaxID=2496865 RepID=UPI000F82749A|nr:hypothetical protein [Maribacter sp. MJ134]AZQ57707.1 hypothetical protein EJ994_02375 [Maribacter sp. MJ134]
MQTHIKIIGALLIILAMVHVIFPRYFKWEKELKALSLINRQMMVIHTLFIAITVFLMGLLCLTSSEDLINTYLGKRICLGLGLFWTIRLIVQFFGYSSELWRRKKFETTIHMFTIILWSYLSSVFWLSYFA